MTAHGVHARGIDQTPEIDRTASPPTPHIRPPAPVGLIYVAILPTKDVFTSLICLPPPPQPIPVLARTEGLDPYMAPRPRGVACGVVITCIHEVYNSQLFFSSFLAIFSTSTRSSLSACLIPSSSLDRLHFAPSYATHELPRDCNAPSRADE